MVGRASRENGSVHARRPDPTIFRVPAHLRDQDVDAYEPQVISFGPYHRGKEKLKLKLMEEQKWCSLKRFLERNPSRDLSQYAAAMQELEEKARSTATPGRGDG